MPELPDIVVYLERLEALVGGRVLQKMRFGGPWVLRTVEPAPDEFAGRKAIEFDRLGKRLVLGFEGDLYAVIHLMVAGRLRQRDPGTALPKKRGLAAFDFDNTTILLTEEGSKRRASLHLVRGREAADAQGRGGVEPLEATRDEFASVVTAERHTLKRALTDPRLLSGIGGAYADEIMHRARLSPLARTDRLDDDALTRLHSAAQEVLIEWTERLRAEVGDGFPEKVTAFQPGMAVHGKYGDECPVCGAPVQRIRYASNETNYCPGCQTGGKILADRALSRILKDDWPRSLEDLED